MARMSDDPELLQAMKDSRNQVGRYWLVQHLKTGGQGVVFRAWDTEAGRWVAIKFLKHLDDTTRAYFRREARLAAGLEHENIARIYETGEHNGEPYIVMEHVVGRTLAEARGDLNLDQIVQAALSVARALRYAHGRKIIHRDLNPANVMVDARGHVYVMDFGLAKETSVESEKLTSTNVVLGTPNYMAPEQAMGRPTEQSDLYGLGAVLYDMVTGRPPFVGRASVDLLDRIIHEDPLWPRALRKDLPRDLEAIILHCLQKDAKCRYADAGRLIEDLEAFRRGAPLVHAQRPTLRLVLAKKMRQRRRLWWALAGAALLVVLASVIMACIRRA